MTTVMPQITDRLAEYVLTFPKERIPEQARDAARRLLLDYLAVALGGFQYADSTPSAIAGVRSLMDGSQGVSTVVGHREGFPAHFAALLNGTFAHSMDFDDTHMGAVIHVGTPLYSTLLALAEEQGTSGADFLAAAVVGYDLIGKVGKAHGEGIHRRGFHPTATTGIFGATAAGARLLGLSHQQLINALGINNTQAAGTQSFLENGAWTKRLQVGLAAHNAIYALRFAANDFFGPGNALEGRFGYLPLYSQDPCDLDKALEGLGEEFEVLNTGVKPFPACRLTHSTIGSILDLRMEGITADDVASMDIYLPGVGFSLVGQPAEPKKHPANIVDGQFSIYFTAAIAALEGQYTWQAYQRLQDPQVTEFMQRVNTHLDDSLPRFGARIVVTTRDRRQITKEVPLPKGEPENPMQWPDMEAKFMSMAEGVLGRNRARQVMEQVKGIERLESITELTRNLRP